MKTKPQNCQVKFDRNKVKANKSCVKLNFTNEMEETFGKWLENLRESRRLNQRELAKLSKVSNTTISLLESNKISQPRFKSLDKIAKALGITSDEIRAAFSERQLSKKITYEHSVEIGKGVLLVFPEKCKVTKIEKENLITLNRLIINGLLTDRLLEFKDGEKLGWERIYLQKEQKELGVEKTKAEIIGKSVRGSKRPAKKLAAGRDRKN